MLYQIYIFKFIIRLVEHHEASPALTPQKRTSTGGNQSPNTGTYHSETCQGVQLHLLCRCAGEMSLKITDGKCCFVIDFLQFELLSVTHTNSAQPQD